jgi:hypothetical protein
MKKFIFAFLSILFISTAWRQSDSLIFNGDIVIAGEIKNLNRGIIMFETDYSDSDFKIEWNKVREIYGRAEYIITLSSGERLTSPISTNLSVKSKVLLFDQGKELMVKLNEVVFIKPLEEGFLQNNEQKLW